MFENGRHEKYVAAIGASGIHNGHVVRLAADAEHARVRWDLMNTTMENERLRAEIVEYHEENERFTGMLSVISRVRAVLDSTDLWIGANAADLANRIRTALGDSDERL